MVGPSYTSLSPNAAIERCVNLYPELIESHSDAQTKEVVLYGTPGYRRFCLLPGPGGVRGLYTTSRGRCFAVVAERVYELFSGGTFLLRGTLTVPPSVQPSSQTGPVSMADDGVYLVVVDGQPNGGWTLKLAPTTSDGTTGQWQAIHDSPASAGFTGARRVDFFDGFFVFDSLEQPGVVYISGLYDPLTDDPTEFATAESSPDAVIGHIVNNREWWLFGSRSLEVWYDAGAQEFPFAPISGTASSAGLAACFSLQTMGNRVYWLSQVEEGAAVVVRNNGYQPERISTHAIENAIRGKQIDDCIAYAEQWGGHGFYVLSFPTANMTWAYDTTMGLWHERAHYTPQPDGDVSHDLGMDLAQYHCFYQGQHLMGGAADGRIFVSDPDYYWHDTDPIVRDRIGWHVKDPDSLRYLYWSVVELDLERGVGLDGGVQPGTDPQVMLKWSDDGGHTWTSFRQASFGALGQYRQRALWRRLGKSRDRVPWIRITDPVKVALVGARMEVT